MATTRKCAICGKEITSGFLFDGVTAFCNEECATKFFNNDAGCVEILIDDGNRLQWRDKFEEFPTFNIKTPHDVAKFFIHLVFDRHVNIDPDETVSQYVEERTGKPTFTLDEALEYDRTMERCFDICTKYDRDIYKLAQLVLGLYHYADCNDIMATFCLGEA